MSEITEVVSQPEVVAEPVVTEVVTTPEPAPLPELRYEYQPTDEHGNKLGGKQVILYRTPEELAEKLRDQNVSLVRKLREVTRKNRLGQIEEENLPTDLERLPKSIEFKEIPLSLEERYQISQDLNDPTKFESARDKLFESAVGATPKDFREQQKQQQYTVNQLLARANAQQFIESHDDFYVCEENLETITDWMIKNELSPTVKNFELAHSAMQEAGLLIASPIVREEASKPVVAQPTPENTTSKPQTSVEEPTRISGKEQPQEKRQAHVPSGLNSRVASSTGPTPAAATMTLADIDRMSSDEYKRRLRDPEFVKLVEKLESQRPPRPRR